MIIFAVIIVFFLAYANGANDNFKGVATLMGSGTASYRKALWWGTLTTAFGSLMALLLAQGLLAVFTGKGLVPESVVAMKSFSLSVVLAAATTVMLATKFGFPISTTHALTGALAGSGYLASPVGINLVKLGTGFFAPLFASPIMAVLLAVVIYPLFHNIRKRLNVTKETCVCVGTEVVGVVPQCMSAQEALAAIPLSRLSTTIGDQAFCRDRYQGQVLGVRAGTILDGLHYVSGGIVGFARGLNDTPKIAAIILAGSVVSPYVALAGVALFMAIGGFLNAAKVAETMSLRVTTMNAGQGFTANVVTGLLVIFASRFGLPVSTTHVSCGSLFGIGAVTRQAQWKTIAGILAAWVTTLPCAALLGAGLFLVLRRMVG